MATRHLQKTYGMSARNQLSAATDRTATGARAALESFYYALNHGDFDVLSAVWADDPLALLNNPLGGSLYGSEITDLYRGVLRGAARLNIEFGSIIEYAGPDHVVFAGRETGSYVDPSGNELALAIRTTRYFRFDADAGRWAMLHHHGSIDDPRALRDYQHAARTVAG
jgi:ketosteroid isomerase-like protein